MIRWSAIAVTLFAAIPPAFAGDLPKPLTGEDFRSYPEAQVKLGQLLFYDRILSGTYRVSCATCHNHDRASSNGVRLDGKEEERDDLAVNGEPVYEPFKPSAKHAPPLFNLGAKQFTRMFSDGRVERLSEGSFRSPAGKDLPQGLNDVLAIQALFPAVQSDELVGKVENDLTVLAHKGSPAIWGALAARIRRTEEYWPHFEAAFPELESADGITITHVANSIGAFVGTEWRSDDAPFDRYLRGDQSTLTGQQKRGIELFYGKAKCDACHSGALQTDHKFHRTGLGIPVSRLGKPVIGRMSASGRFDVTGDSDDYYRNRTPSLRNISASAPYGPDGILDSMLETMNEHIRAKWPQTLQTWYTDPVTGSEKPYKGSWGMSDMPAVDPLNDNELTDLIAFLGSLTDEKGLRGKLGKPAEVPSSLALD